ncbi:DUF4395 domain-containing protein [Sulfurimonas sp. HSL-1716]|uniref:DUF4395 domain-containing protein n=1 Tax=Hydrocurvibacter sulfurireducens TaxID=3131937 RepID=UPI0031F7C906
MKELFAYGEKVAGYDVRVLNEREARAAAGILFVGAFLGLTNGVMLGTAVFSEYFVSFFALDFTIRVIKPKYAPSLLIGRFFVQNQTPEYVGAEQKRFAWLLGMIIAWPMFYYLVIDFQPNPIKVLVCLICMALLFLEAAFSICLGCKIFSVIRREKASHCPGGVCEMRIKEPVQRFSLLQKFIVVVTFTGMIYGGYAYMTKLPDRTFLVKKLKVMMMSEAELKKKEQQEYQKQLDEFDKEE